MLSAKLMKEQKKSMQVYGNAGDDLHISAKSIIPSLPRSTKE